MTSLTFYLPEDAAVEALPDAFLLFSPVRQQIHQLNETSVVLARGMAGGATFEAIADRLSVLGLDEPLRSEWAVSFLRELSDLQLLEAEASGDAAAAPVEQRVSIAGMTISIVYTGDDLFSSIGPAFSHLLTGDTEVRYTYSLSAAGEFVLLGRDGGRPMVLSRERAGVVLKALILEDVLRAAYQLCALHAACLRAGEEAVLLLGAPGAGKSTLTLALLDQGFEFSSDDVTLVLEAGRVHGVPLAPSLKQGTWELLRSTDPAIADLPLHVRPDGQTVRFLPVEGYTSAGSLRVALVVRLCRSPGQQARLDAIGSAEALAEMLKDARSPDASCSAEIFHAMAELVKGARCVELTYSEAREAAAAIRNYVHG